MGNPASGVPVRAHQPKILLWDLETFPNLVTSWGLRVDGYLSSDNIVQERTIICASWKLLGKAGIRSVCVTAAVPVDDRQVVETLHEIVSGVDAVIAHNGDSFDMRWLNARIAFHGLTPLPPVIQIDTKKIAKRKFNFNSNKLDYLAKYLQVGKKIKTEFDLWKECLAGDEKALAKMVRYNRHDIVILEAVYKKLAPYVPYHVNQRLFTIRPVCSHCGDSSVQSRGWSYTKERKYRRYQCQKCGNWFRDRHAEKAQ